MKIIQKIKDWLVKTLGGYTQNDYIKDISLLDNGYVYYKSTIYEPVRVSAKTVVNSKDISGFSRNEIIDYMLLVERDTARKIVDSVKDSEVLMLSRSEDEYGDVVVEATLNILVPRKIINNQSKGQAILA